jgi:hypothetical protein
MCLKFFKNKFKKKIKKKKSESYLKASGSSPILSINGISITNRLERNIYDNRDYETNPLMESLSVSLSPPHSPHTNFFPKYDLNYDEEYLISPPGFEIGEYTFPEPEIKIK